jgi:hypothetical protein
MLTKLTLQNFRGFRDHKIPFRPTTVIVGKNNAGKSTIAEALRLVSIVTSRYQHLTFRPVPSWLTIPIRYRGIVPSLRNIDFDYRNICFNYGTTPAEITATFQSGVKVRIFLNPSDGQLFATVQKGNGDPIISKSQAANLEIPQVHILPQIAPLEYREKILIPEYIKGALDSNLASLHFRNQINLLWHCYDQFKELAETSWPGLQIQELGGRGGGQGEELSLYVRDGGFVSEIGWMGHGLQIWLQTMWFLARVSPTATVILDEPDVYLHADLQRNLFRLIRPRYKQIIVATHSIEILSEAKPEEILVVDKTRSASKFANSLPAVQDVVDTIGGLHNLHLSRLWTARRCLMVEGDDVPFLKAFQNVLFPDSKTPIDAIPNFDLGGWGGWKLAVGSSLFLKNAANEQIKAYCILDRDYHSSDEIAKVKLEAASQKLQMHIWARKEIENYLIVPAALLRYIVTHLPAGKVAPTLSQIEAEIDRLCEAQKDDVFSALVTELLPLNRDKGAKFAVPEARKQQAAAWASMDGKIAIVSGKALLSALSRWSKAKFGVSFGRLSIAQFLRSSEVDSEVKAVVSAIENLGQF